MTTHKKRSTLFYPQLLQEKDYRETLLKIVAVFIKN